jgi:thioredoxin 1
MRIIILIIFCLIGILSIAGLCNDEIKIIELTIDNYQQEFLECDTPIVVYFWAVWCKPCKLMSPIIERLTVFYGKKVKFLKVDVDRNRKLLNNFRPLRGLPLLIFLKNGKEVDRILGFTPFITIHSRIILLLKKEKKDRKEDKCKGGVCDPPEGYKNGRNR